MWPWEIHLTRANKKVRDQRISAGLSGTLTEAEQAARNVEAAFATLEGRWKLLIIFSLFEKDVMRFSELERAIPAVSQKMLTQHLRQLEAAGIVARKVYAEVPPKGRNRGSYSNPQIDKLVDAGRGIEDFRKRVEHYKKVQRIIYEDLPLIPLWYDFEVAVASSRVKDYVPSKNGDYTSLTKVQKQ